MKTSSIVAVVLMGLTACAVEESKGPASSTTTDTGVADTSGGGAECTTTVLVAGAIAECFRCMQEKCCVALQACDKDPDCPFCMANPVDTSARCVDPETFRVPPVREAFDTCQKEQCTPPCGVPGGGSCTPSDCPPSCPDYARGCK